MTIRTAQGGGTTVRWAYGVLIALCAALAVLVHHETAAVGASPMTSASSVMNAASMRMMNASSMADAAPAGHVMPGKDTPSAWDPSSPNTADKNACDGHGMQHCAPAGVDTVQIAVPAESGFSPFADLGEAAAGRAPVGVVGRAPPDLSILSQLRM
ncbi:hypothetical protein ACFY0P_29115 [Streptomyces sp. NPDC001714]|uniref:hypothetical protein n=1 Tax=Streptomyces sp. NPDC001714 TaxID=3364603 RepID=UPI0036C47B6E